MSEPTQAIQEIKEKHRKERAELEKELDSAISELDGNPAVKDALQALAGRVKNLEEKID